MIGAFLYVVLLSIVRRTWIAGGLVLLFVCSVIVAEAGDDPVWMTVAFAGIAGVTTVVVFLRFGLLALATALSVNQILQIVPLTLDLTQPHGAASALAIATVGGLAAWAFSTSRAGEGMPKQWRKVGGKPVLRWSAEALLAGGASPVVVVVARGQDAEAKQALDGLEGWTLAAGGATRALSVQSGLALVGETDVVLVHDAARPFVTGAQIAALVAALAEADGAVPALPVADTLKRERGDGRRGTLLDGLRMGRARQAERARHRERRDRRPGRDHAGFRHRRPCGCTPDRHRRGRALLPGRHAPEAAAGL